MELEAFKATLRDASPPQGLDSALEALWYEAKGDWHRAHEITQARKDDVGAWVHAYLHRREGDLSNASYWYRRANRPSSSSTLDEEWSEIVTALLDSE